MSSRAAISVRGLSKQYRIRHRGSQPTNFGDWLRSGWSGTSTQETFWALKDASFDVAEGEAIGIIGHNGAGKSTLLKILSRIVEPTSGEAIIRGRLGSLLEVGTGFHPDLTGRENIFLNGSILGMRRHEVQREFDAIVDFSGVERFLDTPVKRYSSGMYVRLAFAVAAHLQSDILIVDEVLAVGDAAFQAKCLKKMDEVGEAGRTVLLVSHNMRPINALAKRTILLGAGSVIFDGPTDQAIEQYLRPTGTADTDTYKAAPRPDGPTITRVEVLTSDSGQRQQHGRPMRIRVEIQTTEPAVGLRLGIRAVDRLGRTSAFAWRFDAQDPFGRSAGHHTLECRFPSVRLGPGRYFLRVTLTDSGGQRWLDDLQSVCPFDVLMDDKPREGGWTNDDVGYLEDSEWSYSSSA